jgi:hypothetical protein
VDLVITAEFTDADGKTAIDSVTVQVNEGGGGLGPGPLTPAPAIDVVAEKSAIFAWRSQP